MAEEQDTIANVYQGPLGNTSTRHVHYRMPDGSCRSVEVYASINQQTHPELAARALSAEPREQPNVLLGPDDEAYEIHVPLVYHAPSIRVFALVLPESARHREIEERIALYQRLADDDEFDLPEYVRGFVVVYGPSGLERQLEDAVARASEAEKLVALEQRLETERANLASEREQFQNELRARQAVVAEGATTDGDTTAVVANPLLSETSSTHNGVEEAPPEYTAQVPAAATEPTGIEGLSVEEVSGPVVLVAEDAIESVEPVSQSTLGLPPELATLREYQAIVASRGLDVDPPEGPAALAIEGWIERRDTQLILVDGSAVRLVATVSPLILEQLVGQDIAIRLQFHRFPTAGLISLAFGSRRVLSGAEDQPFLVFHFDVTDRPHRDVLMQLSRDFEVVLELYDHDYLQVGRRRVAAPLSENVMRLLTATTGYNHKLPNMSFDDAVAMYYEPAYDQLAQRRPDHAQFNEDQLIDLSDARAIRRALAIVRHFSSREQEDVLVLIRGYSLILWRARRRAVLEAALAVGLWPGRGLCELAAKEGLAATKEDFVSALLQHFGDFVDRGGALEAADVEDNWRALEGEAARLGLMANRLRPPRAHNSEENSQAVGSIDVGDPSLLVGRAVQARAKTNLILDLDDDSTRLEAALELARRGEPDTVDVVLGAIGKLTRGDAVQILSASVAYGAAAVPHLIRGLNNHKSYLRQGSALALCVLQEPRGVAAVVELLLTEPTEIWREVARGLRRAGSIGVDLLSARVPGAQADGKDRIAWAMAHVAAEHGAQALRELDRGPKDLQEVVARAQELAPQVDAEHALVWQQGKTPHGQTVNHVFSRRFFEGLNHYLTHSVQPVSVANPDGTVVLKESDLLEAEPG